MPKNNSGVQWMINVILTVNLTVEDWPPFFRFDPVKTMKLDSNHIKSQYNVY